jgi:hypothetical protein
MKKCPFCAEEIQFEAIKCKHCGEFLEPREPSKPKIPWYFQTTWIVLGFFTIGPFILPLVWLNPQSSLKRKIIWTIGMLVVSVVIWHLTSAALKTVMEYYKLIFNPSEKSFQ